MQDPLIAHIASQEHMQVHLTPNHVQYVQLVRIVSTAHKTQFLVTLAPFHHIQVQLDVTLHQLVLM
jgi:hypothetical protein